MTLRDAIKKELAVRCIKPEVVDAAILKANRKMNFHNWDLASNQSAFESGLKAVTTEVIEYLETHEAGNPFIQPLKQLI